MTIVRINFVALQLIHWIIRLPCPARPGIGNRKSVFEETVIPAVETAAIFPLECMHTSFDVNTFWKRSWVWPNIGRFLVSAAWISANRTLLTVAMYLKNCQSCLEACQGIRYFLAAWCKWNECRSCRKFFPFCKTDQNQQKNAWLRLHPQRAATQWSK